MIVGALGKVTKGLIKGLEDLEIKGLEDEWRQSRIKALLRSTRILRRVPET